MISNNDPSNVNCKFICSICVENCNSLIHKEEKKKSEPFQLMSSIELYEKLITKIAGQNEPIKMISTIIYNHYKNIKHNKENYNNHKFHSVVIGPTGSGKTMIFENISKLLNVPCTIVDATTLTAVGYSGYDCDSCVKFLYEESGYDKEKCETGIIVVDEFDKCKKTFNNNHKDVGGEAVQHGFLKLLDGKEVTVDQVKKNAFESPSEVKINTKNILFIFCGAFSNIDNVIKNEMSSIDFVLKNNENPEALKKVTYDNLIDYGIINELVGRFYYIVTCNTLNKTDLKDIICNKENCLLQQYKDILYVKDKIKLEFENEAIDLIVDLAYGKCGVRSMKNIFIQILSDVMFNAPNMRNQKYIVTKDYILSLGNLI
jgi:ATP-dependent Clp protease ATP-binding subunit ClpX